jgi:hypothetical protein
MSNRVELEVTERFSFADGHEFGAAGAYERLVGRAHFSLDPGAPAQRGVTDIDADGNDLAGVRAPMVAAPLATYCGWNLRGRGHGHGAMHEFSGSTIMFPETAEERHMTGDPRPAITERYPDRAAYVAAIARAARRLVEDGLLLPEDVERAAAATDWGRPRHDVRLE